MRFLVYLSLLCSMWLCGLEFRDATGKMDCIPAHLIDVFYETEQGKALKEDVKNGLPIDFSGAKRPCLSGIYIKQVLEYTHNLESLTKKKVGAEEVQLLDTANYLGIKQETLLYHLANRVWGYLRTGRQKKDLRLSESDEAYIRKIAKPYLNSPAQLLQRLKLFSSYRREDGFICFDFNFKTIKKQYDQEYPFALSCGIADLINNIIGIHSLRDGNKIMIDLSGHSIKEFIIDDWIDEGARYLYPPNLIISLYLAHNGTERIGWSKKRPFPQVESLDFSHNPVSSIDSSVFELARFQRTHGKKFTLIIPHHKLSLQEIALAKQQWYLAVNTLVDQYSKGYNPNGISVIVAMLIAIGTGVVVDYGMQPNSVLLFGGLGGAMVSLLTQVSSQVSLLTFHLKVLPSLAYKLALQTHPDMEKPEVSFHEPLGNTWLEDWRKPQLILNEGE